MRIVKRYVILAILSISLLIQTGCRDKKPYEEVGFILQIGLETDQEDNLIFSMTTPVIAPGVDGKVEFLHSTTEKLLRAARERIRNESGKLLLSGKVQHIYFSKDLAKRGIDEFLEVFFRDPENPLLANIIVVDGSPKEMMEFSVDYKDKPRSAIYVNGLIRDARRRAAVPETRVYNFRILHYAQTIDPVAPFFRYDKKNIEVAGAALFSRDKMVGELNIDQTTLLNILLGKKSGGKYIYEGQNSDKAKEKIKRGAIMMVNSSNRKINIDMSGNEPVIDIKLQLKTVLNEYAGPHNLDSNENKKKLEEEITVSLKADFLELLKYLQSVESDPIGLGEMVRAKQNKAWKQIQWKEIYREAQFNLDVKLDIEFYGATN